MAESLGAAVLTVSVDDAQLKAGLQAVERQAQSTGTSLEQAFNRTGRPLQTASNGLQFFIDAQGRARDASGKLLTIAQQQAAGIDQVGASAQRAGIGIRGLGEALVALGVGSAAIGFFKGSVEAAVELETITKKLSNTLGSQGAGQALAFTRGLADQLGLSFKTLADTFGSFTAAATAANVPISQQKELFASVARAAQALGLSNDALSGSLLALQQIASKGTVQAEELRGQLGERLPIALGAAAKGLGVTQKELLKLVESGQLTASSFFPALTKGLNELTAEAGGTATAAQNFQKLANAWDDLQTSFGTNLLPGIIEQVKTLTNLLESFKIGSEANQLGLGGLFGNLGLVPDAGIEAVVAVRNLREEFQLTDKQARALFFDAAKLEGLKLTSTGFLPDANGLERTLKRLPELAVSFKDRSKDATAELQSQSAESQRLLEISAAREEVEKKSLQPAKERLRTAEALQGLEGQARQAGEAQLKIETARAEAAKARAEADKARSTPNNEAGAAKLEAVAETASVNLRTALIEGSEALKQAAQSAAEQVQSAFNALQGGLRGNFDLLSSDLKQQVISNAQNSLNASLATGRFDSEAIRAGIGSTDDLFKFASQLEGLNQQFTNYESAQTNLAKVQEQTALKFADLGQKIDPLTQATSDLAKKEWTVNVSVDANTGASSVDLG